MKVLVIYMIIALLFLTSIELHIHTLDAAASADHGSAVSITSLNSELMPSGENDEINVSPDGALKISQTSFNLQAIVFMFVLMVLTGCYAYVVRLRKSNALLPALPFYGTPSLRAPPQ